MKKKECPSCAMDIDDNLNVCPICGYEFPSTSAPIRWVAIVLMVLSFLLLLYQWW
ncbi:MAG: hypothetical protein K2U26_05100 [Cyclobacteriaceae bacterium]|nr:hypothetical protein [Cyclobacteriaceae bacterium]